MKAVEQDDPAEPLQVGQPPAELREHLDGAAHAFRSRRLDRHPGRVGKRRPEIPDRPDEEFLPAQVVIHALSPITGTVYFT